MVASGRNNTWYDTAWGYAAFPVRTNKAGGKHKAIVYNNNRRNRLAIKKTGMVYWPVKA